MWRRLKNLLNSRDGQPMADAREGRGAQSNQATEAPGQTRITGVRYTFDTKEEPNAERPFAHGYIDGVEGVGREPFERFLVQTSEQGRLGEELRLLADSERDLRSSERERIDLEAEVEHDEKVLARLQEEVEDARTVLDARRSALEAQKSKEERARERLEDRDLREEAPERGSLTYAVIYIVAGIVFIAGDVIMSREVVAKALKLPGDYEPWIFAVGLAMLAVLMKPAYDRLVEKPYWEGRRAAFKWTIIIGAVTAAITLGVLGAFRSEAFKSQQEVARLNTKLNQGLRSGKIQAGSDTEAELRAEVTSLERGVVDSWTGYASFLLSGVLFAAAGAVCLGVGLHHGRDWYHGPHRRSQLLTKYTKASRLDALKSELKKAEERLRALRNQEAEHHGGLEAKRKRLEYMPEVAEVRRQIEDVREEMASLRAARSISNANENIDVYQSGYELADVSFIRHAPTQSTGDGMADPEQITVEATKRPSSNDESDGGSLAGRRGESSTKAESKPRRPFLAVRDAVARNAMNR